MDRYTRLAKDMKYAEEHTNKYKSAAEHFEKQTAECEKTIEKKNQTIDSLSKEIKRLYGEMDVREEENFVRMKELQLSINQLMDRRGPKKQQHILAGL